MSEGSVRWRRQWEIYHRAVELDAEERELLTVRECAGDPELEAEVRSLLAVDAQGFLEVGDAPPFGGAAALGVGDEVGPYRLVETLGEGGMGTVFRAEQEEPLRRTVALKVIRAGMDTASVVRRFGAERQALSRLEHPAIARVLDAGVTEGGRSYFVMELVDGEPIDSFCDRRGLGLDERLELFLAVCSAVQHAHQKGIVHRDLKPANVLVAERSHDVSSPLSASISRFEVKVIDFGIAKFLDAPAGEGLTVAGQLVGTLDAMAPEQVELGGEGVDSRTDVFGLGIVLYELLAGAPPFSTIDRSRSSWSEIEAQIRDREARPPAQSFGALDAKRRQAIAAARSLGPAALRRRLAGDLGWISLRALRPEPSKRYSGVGELAADVARFRAHLPVDAHRPSVVDRVRKTVRRHRVATAVALAFTALVTFFGVALARRTLELGRALERSEAAEREAREQTRRASATNAFLVGMLQRADPETALSRPPTVRDALTLGLEQLAAEEDLDPETRLELTVTIARALRNLRQNDDARAALRSALHQVEESEPGSHNHAIVLLDLASLEENVGEYQRAVTLLEHAMAIQTELGEARSHDAGNTLLRLGISLRQLGRLGEASQALERSREIFAALGTESAERRLASVLDVSASIAKDRGWPERAVALYAEALERRLRYNSEASLTVAVGHNNLGSGYLAQGDVARAGEHFERAAELFAALLEPDHPRRIATQHNLASVAALRGDPDAEPRLRAVLERRRAVLGDEHPEVAGSRASLGGLLLDLGRAGEASPLLERAVASLEASTGPQNPRLARTRSQYGASLLLTGRAPQAREQLEKAIEALRDAHRDGSRELADALRWHAEALRHQGEPVAAVAELERALAMARAAGGPDPWTEIEIQAALARCLRDVGRADEAMALEQEARAAARARWPEGDPRRRLP